MEDKEIILKLRERCPKRYTDELKKHHKDIVDRIVGYNKQHNLEFITFSQAVWHYTHNITQPVVCKSCKTPILLTHFGKNRIWGYNSYCSKQCTNKDLDLLQRRGASLKKNEFKMGDCMQKIKDDAIQQFSNDILEFEKLKADIQKILKENLTFTPPYNGVDVWLSYNHPQHYVSMKHYYKNYKSGESLWLITNGLLNPAKCKNCNENYPNFINTTNGFNKYCSEPNCVIKRRQTERVDKLYQASIDTPLITNPNLKKEIAEITSLSKPQVFYEVILKKDVNLIQQVISRTPYLRQNAKFSERLYHIVNDFFAIQECKRCKKVLKFFSFTDGYNGCRDCGCYVSKPEKEVRSFLEEYNIIFNTSVRSIVKNEIDIFIPSKNIGIEYNGIYWHCDEKKVPNYHQEKMFGCIEKGVQLLQIFSNEWEQKQAIVKSIILSKLGVFKEKIFGRKCKIIEITHQEGQIFLDNNHLQGGSNHSKYNIGLKYNNELVSLMTFGTRKITGGDPKLELLRYASKLNTQVIGGANKMFQYFINQYNPDYIVSYADARYSNGCLYPKLGFKLKHISSPNYWYTKDYKNLESRVKFQKHKLSELMGDKFNSLLTEEQNLINFGYHRIYDCGNYVFEYSKSSTII